MECRPISHTDETGHLWWRRLTTETWCLLHGTRWNTKRDRCSTTGHPARSTVTL